MYQPTTTVPPTQWSPGAGADIDRSTSQPHRAAPQCRVGVQPPAHRKGRLSNWLEAIGPLLLGRGTRRITAALIGLLCSGIGTQTALAELSSVTELRQTDFTWGTYVISRPGRYRLAENISFRPNSPAALTAAIASGQLPQSVARRLGLPVDEPVPAALAGMPLATQFRRGPADAGAAPSASLMSPSYDPAAFGIGFFAAIVIAADDVELDLNGFRIEQSEEHALLQRFFSIIELASAPFIPEQGPHDFGSQFVAARQVHIHNGTLGRSAHHGIHGNDNRNVMLSRLRFDGYEVGAVALNGVRGLNINRVRATNRKDVPVLGTFSAAQFIRPYLAALVRNGSTVTLTTPTRTLTPSDALSDLVKLVNAVHDDVVRAQPAGGRRTIDPVAHRLAHALFHNPTGLVDGNAYSFLLNPLGVAVNGFPSRSDDNASSGFVFSNVHVRDQQGFINEIVALNSGSGATIDPVGAVWQVLNQHPETGVPLTVTELNTNARYLGNPLADAQALVAKAIHAGEFANSRLSTRRSNITPAMIRWVEGQPGHETLADILPVEQPFLCNGDSMFHVNKGVIGFKIDGARNGVLVNTSVHGLANLGSTGSTLCGDYSNGVSHPAATLAGYGGAATRGYSLAGADRVTLLRSSVRNLSATAGSVSGIDVLTDSRAITLIGSRMRGLQAGSAAIDYAAPNRLPTAAGIRVGAGTRRVSVLGHCARRLDGVAGAAALTDESGYARASGLCR